MKKLLNLLNNQFIWIIVGFGWFFMPDSFKSEHLAVYVTVEALFIVGMALWCLGDAIYRFIQHQNNAGCLSISALVLTLLVGGLFGYNNRQALAQDYATRNAQHTETVTFRQKNVDYKKNFRIPQSDANHYLSPYAANNTQGFVYHGTIATLDKKVFCSVFTGNVPTIRILNTGNAAMTMPGTFGQKNVTLAAHTYAADSWQTYAGFTALQKELNPGTHFYVCDGNQVWDYVMYNKTIVDEHDTSIQNPDNWQDKKINPSRKPMLTLYDCYETYLPGTDEIDPNPPKRQVAQCSLQHTWDLNNAPANIRNLFANTPVVSYSTGHKVKSVKAKTPKQFTVRVLMLVEQLAHLCRLI